MTGVVVGKTFLRAVILAGALFLAEGTAGAAGMGRLTVLSHLSEPLRAEIDIVAVEKSEAETLKATLASPDAYMQANLPYPPAALGLALSVETRANGSRYVKLTSQEPISEPFIDLLIELDWAGGKVVRAYTALLDPASSAAPQTAAAPSAAPPATSVPPAPAAPPVETIMGSEMQKQPAPVAPAGEPAPQAMAPAPPADATAEAAPSAPPAEAPVVQPAAPVKPEVAAKPLAKEDTYGPVKRGDTLSKIANQYRPQNVTLDQMLVVLFRNNRSAFVGNNMNRLKTGQVLSVPDPSQVASISAKEAFHDVQLQVADFNAYRERLAAKAGEAVPSGQEAGKAATGRVTPPVEELGKPGAGEPKELLKLSKGEAPGAAGSKALQDKVRGLQEDVAARDKSIQEANERIAKLEKTIKDMQGLLDLKNKGMADLQKPAMPPARAEAPALPKPAPPPAAAPAPAPPAPAAGTPAPPAPPTASAAAPEAPAMAPPAAPGTESPAPGAPAKPKPKPRPKVVTAPPPPPGLLDQALEEPLYLAGGAGVLAVLGFLAYRFVRGRSGGGQEAYPAEKKTSEVSAFAATGTDNGGGMAAVARAVPAQVTEEVDPLAEAEIYLAYGRDGQAEEILKEALQSQPKRYEVLLKLLEIYAKRKDAQAFDPLARDLQAATGGTGEFWLQAARLGYQLEPSNPRYQAGKPTGEQAAALEGTATDKKLDFQVDAFEPAPEIGTLTDIDAGFGRRFATGAASTPGTADHIDLNIGMADTQQAVGSNTDIDLEHLGAAAGGTGVDVDLDSLGGATRTSVGADIDFGALAPEPAHRAAAVDFNLELPPSEDKSESRAAKVDALDFDLKLDDVKPGAPSGAGGGLDLDIGNATLEVGPASKHEPVLDLGKSVPPMPEFDLSSISLELGDAPPAAEAGAKDDKWYDVQTKFDLAKAYQEMGDKEGAREILHEVMSEGDSDQKAAAQKVLEALT